MTFKDMKGTVKENLERIEGEKDVLENEIKKTAAEIAAAAGMKDGIEEYSDILTISLDKEKIRAKLLKTRKTFFIEGWVPERCVSDVSAILDENGCCYTFRDPLEDEEVPVLMENRSMVVPFEAVTEMYSLPAYRGFDPTSIFALFYAVFFGMLLSDAGYGILMAVGCWAALRKFDLEGMTYKMVKLLCYCGISTTVWGALFGGWFGDIVPVFTRTFLLYVGHSFLCQTSCPRTCHRSNSPGSQYNGYSLWRRYRRLDCTYGDFPFGTHSQSGNQRSGRIYSCKQTAVC